MTDAPSSDDVNQSVDPLGGYRSPRRLVFVLTIALLVYLVAVTAGMVANVADWRLTSSFLAGQQASDSEIARVDHWIDVSDNILRVAYVVCAPTFLIVLYVLARNAGVLRRNSMTAPATAVIWFFVPVLSLFMPYLVVQRIWQASSSGQIPWRENPASPIVRRWWAFWILSIVIGVTVLRLKASVVSPADYRNAIAFGFLASAVNIGLGVTAIMMLRRLSSRQEQRYVVLKSKLERACSHCGERINRGEPVCPVCGASCRISRNA